jgi:serine/threonine protein kinase
VGCTVIELLDGRPPYHKLDPMPALFRIVNDEHPPLPEGASPAVRDFLLQCFQKDPNFRVSARKLLKHPWIAGPTTKKPANTTEDIGATTKFEDAVRSVQQWNEAIKSPGGAHGAQSDIRIVQGQGGTPSLQRTNLRAGVVAGVTMTPPKFRESVMDKQIAGKTDPFRSPESSRMSFWGWTDGS